MRASAERVEAVLAESYETAGPVDWRHLVEYLVQNLWRMTAEICERLEEVR